MIINFLFERIHLELNVIRNDTNFDNNYVVTQNDQLNEQKMLNLFLPEFTTKYNSIISQLFYGLLEKKVNTKVVK